MGQVFEAHDRVLNRRVALKVPWPEAHTGQTGSLRHEARALAAFRHPSLPTIYTAGVHRGLDYIVMERIYGVSLARHIEERLRVGPFSCDEVTVVLRAIADGLAVVHHAGIAHRDVKPDNVMLAGGGRVVLMDFGLVLPEFDVSKQVDIAGSPAFMAPEALANTTAAGSAHLLDIYSLGVIAFEMLIGQLPRKADSLLALWEQHDLPLPSIRKLRPDTPAPLVELVESMLAKGPEERPPSAEAVVWAVDGIRNTAHPEPIDVLVVDDNPDIARVLGFYAEKALGACRVRTARDGEEAIARLRDEEPDVMLLDLDMPRMNGIEVCMYARGAQLAERCRIIAVSAGAQPHDRQLPAPTGHHPLRGQGWPHAGTARGSVARSLRARSPRREGSGRALSPGRSRGRCLERPASGALTACFAGASPVRSGPARRPGGAGALGARWPSRCRRARAPPRRGPRPPGSTGRGPGR